MRRFSLLAVCGFLAVAYAVQPLPPRGVADADEGESYSTVHKKVDPIAVNGEIFVEWPKPVAALLISGDMNGYLEPCGCTGLENQKGGLKRRHTLIKQLEADGWPLAKFDLGGLTRRIGPQAEIKYRYAVESLLTLGYSLVNIGANELKLSSGQLLYAIANLDPEKNPVSSANVGLAAFDSGLTSRYRVIDVGRRRFGAVAVLGEAHVNALPDNPEIVSMPPATALAEIAPILAGENCDHQVLLVHGTLEEAQALARKYPQFDLIAAAGGADEPPNRLLRIPGANAKMIEVGKKGTYVVVLGFYDDPEKPIRFERVPLDHRFENSPAMQKMMEDYQNELELIGLAGLGLSGDPHPRGRFVGSAVCADCHDEESEILAASHHAHATDSLLKADPPRQYDPECLSCHVVGWNPQEYFPYASGFMGLEKTPHLTGNGCENCHGPAQEHVAVENGDKEATDAQIEAIRASLHLEIVENEGNKHPQVMGRVVENCIRCHDVDNSPDFNFQEYWEREVKHGGE